MQFATRELRGMCIYKFESLQNKRYDTASFSLDGLWCLEMQLAKWMYIASLTSVSGLLILEMVWAASIYLKAGNVKPTM